VLTNEELIKIGRRVVEARERDKARVKAQAAAVKKLVRAHQEEYQKYLLETSGR